MNKLLIIGAVVTISLSACQSSGWGQKQSVGTLLGAGGGALLGNQFGKGTGNVIATAVGTIGGALLGNEIGSSLDNADRSSMQQAQVSATQASIGQKISWIGDRNEGSVTPVREGSVTPVREGTSSDGRYCREFNNRAIIGNRVQDTYGTACRQPDGSWQVIR
jgi:surface antigen